ncbi:hypothetical protein P7C70_g3116, partial [Phenoliferia sp. Uapishka_3]
MENTIFDPAAVKATLKVVLKARQHVDGDKKDTNKWIVNWNTDWTDEAVSARALAWVKAGCVGSLEQLEFTAHVLEYMKLLERGLSEAKGLPLAFPIYGPTFYPPTVEYDALRNRSIFKEPARYLVEPVMVINQTFFAALNLAKCPVDGCTATKVESKGITANGYTTIYGTHSNFKAIGRQYHCAEPGHGGFCTTSADYWKTRNPWEITAVPHFTHRGGSSRDLYDYVTELRTHTTIGEMEEAITQLHGLTDIRRSTAYLKQAQMEIDNAIFKPKFVNLPSQILRARVVEVPIVEPSKSAKKGKKIGYSLTSDANPEATDAQNTIKVNGHPCSNSLRDIYEYFATKQRIAESEQQMRTVCERVDEFKIAFLDCWINPAEWEYWHDEVRRSHFKVRTPPFTGDLPGTQYSLRLRGFRISMEIGGLISRRAVWRTTFTPDHPPIRSLAIPRLSAFPLSPPHPPFDNQHESSLFNIRQKGPEDQVCLSFLPSFHFLQRADALFLASSLHYSRSRPEYLISAQGVEPALSLGSSGTSELSPLANKKRCFLDPEIAQYRTLLGLACSAAAFSDNVQKESTRKHLFDYLNWIHEWMHGDMEQAAYLRLVRRLEASRRRWELVRKTFIENRDEDLAVTMEVWESTEPYKGGRAEDNHDIHAAATKMRRLARLAKSGVATREDGEDIVIPDSEDEAEGAAFC